MIDLFLIQALISINLRLYQTPLYGSELPRNLTHYEKLTTPWSWELRQSKQVKQRPIKKQSKYFQYKTKHNITLDKNNKGRDEDADNGK